MATTIDIAYFNSFYIKSSVASDTWHIEESRIKGGFNEVQIDLGVRAYMVNEDYAEEHRANALTYSGIINSRTGINETNQFNPSLPISKAVNKANGSIQKLYAEETNLLILQEDKVSKALIDKDAIYSAEGGGTVTSSNAVIGQVVPFAGKYGISKNPESFVAYGNRKYFTDKNRGVVLRLSSGIGGGDGLTPISEFGMRDYFRDWLNAAQRVVGMYDTHQQSYIVSLQKSYIVTIASDDDDYDTLAFSDVVKGWTSRYSFKPFHGFSYENNFYTFFHTSLHKHYSTSNSYCYFYGGSHDNVAAPTITFVVNQNSAVENAFYSLDYEGSETWRVKNIKTNTELTTTAGSSRGFVDLGKNIYAYNEAPESEGGYINASLFYKKGQQYCAAIQNNTEVNLGELYSGSGFDGLDVTGVKGNFVQMTFYINPDPTDNPALTSRHELANVKTHFNPLVT